MAISMATMSSRPGCIRVAVIDRDRRTPIEIIEWIRHRLGAEVSVVDEMHLNGVRPPFHVVVLDQGSDPKLEWLWQLREKWSEQDLPVIVVGDSDELEVAAVRAGASRFLDRSLHPGPDFLEKLVYGLACER